MQAWGSGTCVGGKYTLLHPLGRGGMAEVHLARAELAGVDRLVALKRMLPSFTDDPSFLKMFQNEARLTTMLDHPNAVRVLDVGVDGNDHYLVLEYVHGFTLARLLREAAHAGGLPLGSALHVVKCIASGLHAAHELADARGRPLGLVHRDVSPSNVLIGFDGSVRVSDFGVARAYLESETRSDSLKGKASYMSPEQCEGHVLDRRSDVFAVGILLYEATVGRRLFTGVNEFQVMNAIAQGRFLRPSQVDAGYPAALEAVVLKALSSEASQRYATMEALELAVDDVALRQQIPTSAISLRRFAQGLGLDQPYPMPRTASVTVPQVHRWRSRGGIALTIAGTAAVAIAVAIGSGIRGSSARPPNDSAANPGVEARVPDAPPEHVPPPAAAAVVEPDAGASAGNESPARDGARVDPQPDPRPQPEEATPGSNAKRGDGQTKRTKPGAKRGKRVKKTQGGRSEPAKPTAESRASFVPP